MIRKTFLAGAVLAALLAGCSTSVASTPVATPTAAVTETPGSSPQPTVTVTETETAEPTEEPSDEVPPKPKAIDETIYLSGPIILINRAEKADGSCTDRITDVVVNLSADDDQGIKLAHIHGRITIDAQLDEKLRVGISPSNLEDKLTVLEHGEKSFPEVSDLTGCDNVKHSDVLDPFYGQWIVKRLPYNAETWFNL